MQYNNVLIANRGEIALRIMRSVRAQGMRCIAVYSEVDENSAHVVFADDAFCIGQAPASESYLLGENIIRAAKSTGADAIHPGYGFLSENAEFARAVRDAGLVFIGPAPKAIEIMGDKAISKRVMLQAGVPCIPGYQDSDQANETLLNAAEEIGYPLMVKAAAGGGGRGMRLVSQPEELEQSIQQARSEAISAFGSGELILEKAISHSRHVEIQIFADQFGSTVHLGERDCSVQRRHQKVIEESPCPAMTETLRESMGQAAITAAKAVDYIGAGTVEFLLDSSGQFYFLEMNTRLQVEHPVTEMVTGLDLVAMQLDVAQGLPLSFSQNQLQMRGHAIEARIYAENPSAGFLPSTGPVHLWKTPKGVGVRIDDGIVTGDNISPFYDAMVAKVIGYGDTRTQALRRLQNALKHTAFIGPDNNRDFLITALNHQIFTNGEATTAFIEEAFPDGIKETVPTNDDLAAAALIQYLLARAHYHTAALHIPDELLGWSSAASLQTKYHYEFAQTLYILSVQAITDIHYVVSLCDKKIDIHMQYFSENSVKLRIDGRSWRAAFHSQDEVQLSLVPETSRQFSVRNLLHDDNASLNVEGGPLVVAPMHGVLQNICVKEGDSVAVGDCLAQLEAMKMQHNINAEIAGTVKEILHKAGDQLSVGQLILEISPHSA